MANKWENLHWNPELADPKAHDPDHRDISSSSLTTCLPTSFKLTLGYGERRTDSGDKKGNEEHGGNRPLKENEWGWGTQIILNKGKGKFAWNKDRRAEEGMKERDFD